MSLKASANFLRVPPRKARLVADMVRGKAVLDAKGVLLATPNKSAKMISKLIKSALSNASYNTRAQESDFVIEKICVNPGPIIKRMTARAQGRGTPINHRTSHIVVELSQK